MNENLNQVTRKFITHRISYHSKNRTEVVDSAYMEFRSRVERLREALTEEQIILLRECENAYQSWNREMARFYYKAGFGDAIRFLMDWERAPMNYPTAYFVPFPSRLEDLKRPHPAEQRKPYVIDKTVQLRKIDYENFITDLSVDRWFIEENAGVCRIDDAGNPCGSVWHCIVVRQRGKTDGVLVMPDGEDFPKWAAYIPGENVGS